MHRLQELIRLWSEHRTSGPRVVSRAARGGLAGERRSEPLVPQTIQAGRPKPNTTNPAVHAEADQLDPNQRWTWMADL